MFDRVVAENGAVLFRPAKGETKLLAEPPPQAFIDALERRGVAPFSRGLVIVDSREPEDTKILAVIRDLGLELQVIYNKGAVMVLPVGVNKATGLTAALREMGLSPDQVVGVGDAENDLAFLGLCACSVAVSNALPAIKEDVDFVTSGNHGAGVRQLIDELLDNDLAGIARTK